MNTMLHDTSPVMPDQHLRMAAPAAFIFVAALILGGCATSGGATSSAFVDPAKYSLYNCTQLDEARKAMFQRVTELQGLMAKAEQTTGGSFVSGIAYQSEYLTARDNLALIDEERGRNRCDDGVAPPAKPTLKVKRKPQPNG